MITLKRLLPLSILAGVAVQPVNANVAIKEIILEGQSSTSYSPQGPTFRIIPQPLGQTLQVMPYQEPSSAFSMNPNMLYTAMPEGTMAGPGTLMPMPGTMMPMPGTLMYSSAMPGTMMPGVMPPGSTTATACGMPQEILSGALQHNIMTLFQQTGLTLKNMKIVLVPQNSSMPMPMPMPMMDGTKNC